MKDKLRIVVVTPERVPLIKVGGLADVAGALTDALAERGHEVSCFLPLYRGVRLPEGTKRTRVLERFPVPLGGGHETASVEEIRLPGTRCIVYGVDHRGEGTYFQREGVYGDPETGTDYLDNAERYLFFCRAVCESLKRLGHAPDVVHANDWPTGFLPLFLERHYAEDPFFRRTATLFSLHNVGYQGLFPPEALALAQVPRQELTAGSPLEFWGKVNFLKVGASYADLLNTVSERYAQEIRTSDEFGFGLEGVFQERADDLRGILNGIDYAVWNPETDPHLAANYGPADLSGKAACRAALAREAGWDPDSDAAIVGMISRLVDQKGFDLVREAADELVRLEARFFLLGTGQKEHETLVERLAQEHPERFHARVTFDDALAHRIEAGADLFLMPSRYEPCGLNQMMSQRYGTIPVVRATGGLADTVEDFDPASGRGTGFVFREYEAKEMLAALKRALALYRQPRVWARVIANAMAKDFSWERAASEYEDAYRAAMQRAARGGGRAEARI